MNLKKIFQQNSLFRINVYFVILVIAAIITTAIFLPPVVDQIRFKRALLDSRQNLQLNFEQVFALYSAEYSKRNERLKVMRPERDEVIEILDDLQREALAMKIPIQLQNIPVEPGSSPYSIIRYKVAFNAIDTQFFDFINVVESLPVYSEIREVKVDAVNDLKISKLAKYQLTIDFFIK